MPSPLALPNSGGYHKADKYHLFSSKAPHLPNINGATKEFTTKTYRKYEKNKHYRCFFEKYPFYKTEITFKYKL